MNYTDILLKTSRLIMQAQCSQELVDSFATLIQECTGISRMDFLTLDYNTSMFRDFVRDWIYVSMFVA